MMSGKRFIAACVLAVFVLFMQAASSLAQLRTYTFGGSEDDALSELAIASDGRIVMTGYTNSSDGTLADRTKVGRSGWMLCVDPEGNVLWSFVSRLGVHDSMAQPVFHDDGSVTVVLEAEPDGGMELEAIRLDREGKVISRKTMRKRNGEEMYVMLVDTHEREGYAVSAANERAEIIRYALYDYDGSLLGEYTSEEWMSEGSVMAVSSEHVIRRTMDAGVLYRMGDQGEETALGKVYEIYPQAGINGGLLGGRYNSLISLDDGGAAGCGWVLSGTKSGDPRPGRITRWDAQGKTAFDMWLQIGQLSDLVKIKGGYAAILHPEADEPRTEPMPYSLAYFDERGIYRGKVELAAGEDCAMKGAPDGTLIILQRFYKDGQGDVRMTVVDAL